MNPNTNPVWPLWLALSKARAEAEMNPRANQWHWPCQPILEMKHRELLGYEGSICVEDKGGFTGLRFATLVTCIPRYLLSLHAPKRRPLL